MAIEQFLRVQTKAKTSDYCMVIFSDMWYPLLPKTHYVSKVDHWVTLVMIAFSISGTKCDCSIVRESFDKLNKVVIFSVSEWNHSKM